MLHGVHNPPNDGLRQIQQVREVVTLREALELQRKTLEVLKQALALLEKLHTPVLSIPQVQIPYTPPALPYSPTSTPNTWPQTPQIICEGGTNGSEWRGQVGSPVMSFNRGVNNDPNQQIG